MVTTEANDILAFLKMLGEKIQKKKERKKMLEEYILSVTITKMIIM